MAVTQVYRVLYHWENKGIKVNNEQIAYVQAASSDYNTLKGVIVTNQGISHGGSTFVIDNVANIGPGNIFQ
jgi:hypothetical protein